MIAYKIADIGFGFNTESYIKDSRFFEKFRIDEKDFWNLKERITFEFRKEPQTTDNTAKLVAEFSDHSMYTTDDGFLKVTERFDKKKYKCFCYQKKSEPIGEIAFDSDVFDLQRTGAELFRIIDLFSVLAFYNAMILHASVVEYKGFAYIFSGNSGVGKSTHADLWEKYGNAKILNGDRVILKKYNNEWCAYGLPMCGSSQICEVFRLPIGGIFFLRQGKENKVEPLSKFNKITCLLSQLGYGENKNAHTDFLIDFVSDLIKKVRMYEYICTPEKEAFLYLKDYLKL